MHIGQSCCVSIPYSSGHLFRFVFASPIPALMAKCLNPLFIRSSIPLYFFFRQRRCFIRLSQSLIHQVIYSVGISPRNRGAEIQRLNPLFIRSSIPFNSSRVKFRMVLDFVSIPYSSGHLFRSDWLPRHLRPLCGCVSIPYSSGHLFRFVPSGRHADLEQYVSIPYSSGHLFRFALGSMWFQGMR